MYLRLFITTCYPPVGALHRDTCSKTFDVSNRPIHVFSVYEQCKYCRQIKRLVNSDRILISYQIYSYMKTVDTD